MTVVNKKLDSTIWYMWLPSFKWIISFRVALRIRQINVDELYLIFQDILNISRSKLILRIDKIPVVAHIKKYWSWFYGRPKNTNSCKIIPWLYHNRKSSARSFIRIKIKHPSPEECSQLKTKTLSVLWIFHINIYVLKPSHEKSLSTNLQSFWGEKSIAGRRITI